MLSQQRKPTGLYANNTRTVTETQSGSAPLLPVRVTLLQAGNLNANGKKKKGQERKDFGAENFKIADKAAEEVLGQRDNPA